MRAEACSRCAGEKFLRAQLEGEVSSLAWALQKARERLKRTAQEVEAVTAMMDAELSARGNRRRTRTMLKHVA